VTNEPTDAVPEVATVEVPPRLLFDEARSADIVVSSFARTTDPRLREVLTSLVEHLHAFVKEVALTPGEWAQGIDFLTETGRLCDKHRQEFILLSDTLGVSMLVESLANSVHGRITEATVEGPFHQVASPERALGADLNTRGAPGQPCVVAGRVVDEVGDPIAGAKVDAWQADARGFYDVQRPDDMEVGELRGLFTADEDGGYWFRTIVPSHYPIPADGPVGTLLRRTGRHEFRPAHVHLEVSAAGMRTVTTHVFVAGSPYLDSDTVFGVKESLVREFVLVDDEQRAATLGVANPFRYVEFDVVLQREG
jgi:catechol 1,2-dioxygenase